MPVSHYKVNKPLPGCKLLKTLYQTRNWNHVSMAKKCGTAGGKVSQQATTHPGLPLPSAEVENADLPKAKWGLPLQQTCFNHDLWENSRKGNILAMPCWSFFKAAITEEEKGSVSPTTPHPQLPPAHQSLSQACSLISSSAMLGSSFSLFSSLKQLHQCR